MKRTALLLGLVGFVVWRARRLDRLDRTHGYGAYAPAVVRPGTPRP